MKTILKAGFAAGTLLAFVAVLAVRAGGPAPTLYAVTNLGPGFALNANNPDEDGKFSVVGATFDPDVGIRATVWTLTVNGAVEDVFIYDKGLGASLAVDVNDDGMVVIGADLGNFVDVPGVGLKLLPSAQVAAAINNDGVVAGSIAGPPGTSSVGAVWRVDGTGATFGPVIANAGPGAAFKPNDVNDEGTLAGFYFIAVSDSSSAAVAEFDRSGALDLRNLGVLLPGDSGAEAFAINSHGTFVGSSFGMTETAFLRKPGQQGLTSLGDLGGGSSSAAGINDDDQVVGFSFINANVTVGFIWQKGKMTDLNSVLAAPLNDTIDVANGITNTGHIVGGLDSGSAFVLTPQ
jgi:probable HAF family extracellular repeat protein